MVTRVDMPRLGLQHWPFCADKSYGVNNPPIWKSILSSRSQKVLKSPSSHEKYTWLTAFHTSSLVRWVTLASSHVCYLQSSYCSAFGQWSILETLLGLAYHRRPISNIPAHRLQILSTCT